MSSNPPRPAPSPGPPALLPRPGATPKIDSIYDFSNKGLGELKSWIEIWFKPAQSDQLTPAMARLEARIAALEASREGTP